MECKCDFRTKLVGDGCGSCNPELKMTVEKALELADEWNRGFAPYVGAQGWLVVCMLLAGEVRRLHGIGGELIAARSERDELAAAVRQTLDQNSHLADGDVCTLKSLKDALLAVGIDWAKEVGDGDTEIAWQNA